MMSEALGFTAVTTEMGHSFSTSGRVSISWSEIAV